MPRHIGLKRDRPIRLPRKSSRPSGGYLLAPIHGALDLIWPPHSSSREFRRIGDGWRNLKLFTIMSADRRVHRIARRAIVTKFALKEMKLLWVEVR